MSPDESPAVVERTPVIGAPVPTPGGAGDEEPRRIGPLGRLQHVLHAQPTLGPAAVLVLMVVVFTVLSPRFLRPTNLSLIVQQVMTVGTLAIGQTIIILTAGVDLSVGAIMLLVTVSMGRISAEMGIPGVLVLGIGFVVGIACGLLNGTLITRLRLPPFIVTLGSLNIFFALTLYVSRSVTIAGDRMDPLLLAMGNSVVILGTKVTYGTIAMLGMYVVMAVVLRTTAWGKHIYATGDDPEAARLAGIRTRRVLISVYATAGCIYAVAAWFLIGRIQSASPLSGAEANLDTITAVVIGGTSLFGGRGRILGTLLGALIVGGARNGLTLIGVDPLWQDFAVGVLVIGAVAMDQWVRRVSA
jgi:fructose transport system permease protein